MKLLVGLGNPGPKYARNRHNVGFMAVEAIGEHHGFDAWRKRFQSEAAEGRLAGEKCLLLKPTTYMNESGRAVGDAVRFFKLAPEDVIVFHDELDLEPEKVRVKTGGGNAGHNGLRSLSSHLGNDFVRVRIGIGHPGRKDLVYAYVLHDFAKSDADWLEPLIAAIAENAGHLVLGEAAKFMSALALARGDKADDPAPDNSPRDRSAGRKKWDVVADQSADEDERDDPSSGGPLAQKLKSWLTRRGD